ncbi:MAG: FHIPEP family type III secretion protein, partial [Gammaproteobacteria bacterium]|nr:FHIPEP family type III secretion protein [Gammaproteobacteria bacterium]
MEMAETPWWGRLTERRDLVLAALLVMIIFMMILPLPTMVVDSLIAINMSLSVILLMVAIYLRSVVSFSTLPS